MDFLFLLKKIIGVMIMPINAITALLIVALILYKKYPSLSIKFTLSATLLLLLTSIPLFSDLWMKPLENQYEAFTYSDKPVEYFVILGCGHTSDPAWPDTSQLKSCSLQRMVEGFRISELYPQATIITSGFGFSDPVSNAEKVKRALISLGVKSDKIITENFPKDTEEEAELISPRVKGKQVVLVTNADHMPRAITYFQQQGVNAIPAPASPMVKGYHGEKSWSYYVPNSHKLTQSSIAWYESIGLAVQWLKSLFN